MKQLKLILLTTSSILVATVSTASSIYQDDFNRSDSDSLGSTPGTGNTWSEFEGTTGSVSITDNQLRIADSNPGNDGNRLFVNHDLDAQSSYSVSFTADFSAMTTWSYSNAGMWILPRAEGNDLPGNIGWYVRMYDQKADNNLNVYSYSGGARDANGSLGGTALIGTNENRLDRDYLAYISVAVTGDSAVLTIDQTAAGGLLFTSAVLDLTGGGAAVAGNSTADSFMLGANQLNVGNRSMNVYIDDLVVVPEPSSVLLFLGGLMVLVAGSYRKGRCRI